MLGSSGQLGRALLAQSDAHLESGLQPAQREDYPQERAERLSRLLSLVSPQVIINAAAFTDVERAEREPALAWAVNRDGVARLAGLAKQHNALLVHFSTDYLFDGSGDRPWRESDRPAPLNVYGHSKWAGEQAIMASGCRYLIIRTSWLHSPWRHNFLKTILGLAQRHRALRVVCDQIGAPTSASWLAAVTWQVIPQVLANPALAGCYHVTARGAVSWHGYADFILHQARQLGLLAQSPTLVPVAACDYPALAARPANSRLDVGRFERTFGLTLPPWQQGVMATLHALSQESV
nr:dTDP-4-dehydrorhamnose reductase [Aeromonas fluvialis]